MSVRYRVPTEPVATLKEHAIRILQGRGVGFREFWALRRVNIDVVPGEAFGIIGRNGAGKSTLLKVVSRILRPTEGRVIVRGAVSPLIELGTGFHPELTGRENVYLKGAMLGFSRAEMEMKIGRIIQFAELESFMDAPLRTYSSGMTMRLGFSIATDVNPDVLIIDEILSVGDEAFQKKSFRRMRQFQEQGITLLYVSHGLESVRELCDRVAWIEDGRTELVGEPKEVIEAYRDSFKAN